MLDKLHNLFPSLNILQIFSIAQTKKQEIIHTFLPEDIRYALQYKKAMINYNELWTLLDSSYGRAWFYAMMKFYDNYPSVQESIFAELVAHSQDIKSLYISLRSIHAKNKLDHNIQCNKLSTLSKYNFVGRDVTFDEIVSYINQEEKTPIILLYAWLLSLPSFLTHYNGNTIRLLNPKNPSGSIKLSRNNNNWIYSHEVPSDVDRNYVFIDDIYNTGNAYTSACKILEDLWCTEKLDMYAAINLQWKRFVASHNN